MNNRVPFIPTPGKILILPKSQSTSEIKTTLDDSESNIGEVIAIGNTFISNFGASIQCPVKVGDIINHADTTSMGTSGYTNISLDGEMYRVVLFDAILGVIG